MASTTVSSNEIDTGSGALNDDTAISQVLLGVSRTQMQAMIEEVRAKFLEEAAANPDLYDPSDIELARNDDWQIERFILRKKSADAAVEMIKGTLRWRRETNMPQLKDTDFPEEFFKIGGMFGFETDLEGNGVVYLRVRLHRKIKELEQFVKLFMMHTVNKMDMAMNGKGISVVFDCSGAGISNLDMDIIWFLVESLIKYYPYGLKHILVYEMPWILTSAWTIIKGWMPAEFQDSVKFITKKNITQYIAKDKLPRYLGGESKLNYHQVPKGCRTATEMASEQGLTEKDLKKMMKAFRPFLDEADAEIQTLSALNTFS